MEKDEKIEKLRLYYSDEMYEGQENILKPVSADGATDVLLQPVFNPLKRIINNLYSLAFKNFDCSEKIVKDIWDLNNFEVSKKKLISEAILTGESYLEVIKSSSDIKYIFHKVDDVEVEKDFGEILKFSFTGVAKIVNEDGEIEENEIEKTYFKIDEKVFLIINDESPLYIGDTMPIFEFNFGLDLFRALYYIDTYNELESESRTIINLHSSPEKLGRNLGIKKPKEEQSNNSLNIFQKLLRALSENRFRKQRMIVVEEKEEKTADIKYIEMDNTWVNSDILPKMEQVMNDFKEEFPELDLKVESGNVAIRTYLMSMQGLRSKISTIRDSFIEKIRKVDSYSTGKEIDIKKYSYSDIFEQMEEEANVEILNKKLDALEKVNRIQSDDRILKIVNDLSEGILEGMSDE